VSPQLIRAIDCDSHLGSTYFTMRKLLAALSAVAVLTAAPCPAQSTTKQPQPGFNLFSVSQDIEIGKQSAVEAEKQLQLLNHRNTDRYLNRMVTRLAASAPGAKYPYSIKTVNAAEINAFALPGGPMYVNRGLLETARNEAELAGVLAHEMSHVALRHGTHQASKAYLAQSGLGILGGLLGRSAGTSNVVNAIGGVGLNVVFLKFSRDDEYQADLVGAQIMAKAGYDPLAMASLFELLRSTQTSNPGKVERFLSDHPSSADREARIRQQATALGGGRTSVLGGFDALRSGLRGLPAASSQQTVAQSNISPALDTLAGGEVIARVDAPSSRFLRFQHASGFFAIDYPDNWNVYPSGLALSLAPEGGVVTRSDGRQVMLYGVIVNHYAPFASAADRWSGSLQRSYVPFEDRARPRAALEDATDDLVSTILSSNPYLSAEAGPARAERIDAAPGFSVLLSGRSPVTGEEERVTVYTRGLPDGHVIYALFTVPGRDYNAMQTTFTRMLRTLLVNDEAAHRTAANDANPRR
jgi:Zn-dependent protease with chaperone function